MTSLIESHLSDPSRVTAVRDSGLLDTPAEDSFDRLTRLTCKMVHAPAAMLSLLDSDRQFIKSGIGLEGPWSPGRSVSVTDSFCRHVVDSGEPFVVTDARKHERVQSSPAIRELSIIAYVGLPIRVDGGFVLGSLCAMDYLPRAWVSEEVAILTELAAIAAHEINLRIARQRASREAGDANRRARYCRSLVESAWDMTYVMDAGGVVRDVSAAIQRVLGFAPEEVVGRREADLVHPDDLPRVAEAFERDIRCPIAGPPQDLRLRHRNGSWRTVEATRKLLTDEVGQLVAVVDAHDVTDRRRDEEALRRTEERFQLAARATKDVIWEWDLRTGELQWGHDGHRTLRYADGEMGGAIDWWYERIHAEDRERIVTGVQQVLSSVGEIWSAEYRALRGDGSYVTLLDRAYVDRNSRGVPIRMIGSMVDVTERRRAEDAQRFLARASTILDGSLDCDAILAGLTRAVVPSIADLCFVDVAEEDGVLRRVAAADVRPEREDLVLAVSGFPAHADPTRHPVVKALSSGRPVVIRKSTNTLDEVIGQPVDLHASHTKELEIRSLLAIPMVSHERPVGVITLATAESGREFSAVDLVVAEDLARRAAVALENCLLYAKTQQAVRARDAILGVVSHDLRNPLNRILMAASLLLEGSEERRAGNVRGLEVIKRSVHQMNAMIKDLLDASSIDAGRFRVMQAQRDVGSLLADVQEFLQPLAAGKGITLAVDAEAELSAVWVDADQIQRVFSNLIGNAIKFTPSGGAIQVTTERTGAEMVFSVSDTGPGIEAGQLPHVFDRYWQGIRGDRRGAGLGLAIAKGIVEAHAGRIWAESSPGHGSTFRFTVPLVDRSASPDADVRTAA